MRTVVLLELGALLLTGCSPEWYRDNANVEVYDIVDRKRQPLVSEERRELAFSIEPQFVSVDEVGSPGELENFWGTPKPEPMEVTVDVDSEADGARGESAPEVESPEGESRAGTDDSVDTVDPTETDPTETDPASDAAEGDGPVGQDSAVEEGPNAPEASSVGAPGGTESAVEESSAEPSEMSSSTIADMIAKTPKIPARLLSLDDALQLAFANNRDYQDQKEAVYLSALTLTLARWQFAPRFFGIITGDWDKDAAGNETGRVSTNFGFTQLFASGARLSISALSNFFQFFTGDRREVANTILDGTLTQPLLRGFGSDIVLEPLTQSERNVVYQLRAFERFRKTFAYAVISEYYRVVQNIDTVHNAYLNWQSQVDNLDRSEAMEEAQRMAPFAVDQTRNAELQAHDSWVVAVANYEASLDRFKITLGIPVETRIALDAAELRKLEQQTVEMLNISVDDAISLAFAYRLDLQTAADRIEDADRGVNVAADSLRAQLDVTGSASLESGANESAQTPLKFNTADFAYGVGVDLDLPLDRKAERNNYVRQLIALEREKRDYTLFEDNISLMVRDEYRLLEREIIRYGIQQASLTLNEGRAASTVALRNAGRPGGLTTDVLLALDSLNDARNDLTGAIVNFTLARLALFRDLGVLQVNSGNRVVEPDLAVLIAQGEQNAEQDHGNSGRGDVSSTLLTSSRKDAAGETR